MAVRDARLFRLLFEPYGAIARFHDNPNLNFVVMGNYFIAKRPVLRLVRFLLPIYRAYEDDNQLVDVLFKQIDPSDINRVKDFNIRRLLSDQTEPILSDKTHTELEAINNQQDPQQKEQAQNIWVNSLVQETKAPVEEPRVIIAETSTPMVSQPQEQPTIQPIQPAEPPTQPQPTGAGGGRPGMFGIPNIPGFGNILGRGGATRLAPLAARAVFFGPIGWAVGATLILLFVFPIILMLLQQEAVLPGIQGTAQAAPAPFCTTDSSGINLFDKDSMPDEKLQAFIEKNKGIASPLSEEKFTQRAKYIRDTSKEAGFNPAFFLALWRTESGFSKPGTDPSKNLGCTLTNGRPSEPDAAFEWGVKCVLGLNSVIDQTCKGDDQGNPTSNNIAAAVCARNQDVNSEACRCIRDIFAKHKGKSCYQDFNIPVKTVHDYLQAYGSQCYDPNNINTIKNAPKFASETLGIASTNPSGICTAIETGQNTCPLTGTVKTTTGTKAYPEGNPPNGHCGTGYPKGYSWCSVENLEKTKTSKASHALDVSAGGKTDVNTVLPKINGESLVWKLYAIIQVEGIGGGLDFTGKSTSGTEYFLHLYHLNGAGYSITGFTNKPEFNSGDVVSTQLYPLKAGDGRPHLHFTIAKRDSSTGNEWVMLEPNAQLHMCDGKNTVTPTTNSGSTTPVPVGKDSYDKDIQGYKIGNGDYHILIIGGMNGSSEKPGIDVVNSILKTPPDPKNTTLYIIPQLLSGVDGFNKNGKDINRNFDADENKVPGGSWSPVGCSLGRYNIELKNGAIPFGGSAYNQPTSCQNEEISGEFGVYCNKYPNTTFYCTNGQTGQNASFTEPESKVIRDFINSNEIKAVLSFRSGYDDVSHTNSPSVDSRTQELAQKIAQTIGTTYLPYWNRYPVRGQFMDWLFSNDIIGVETEVKFTHPIQNYIQATQVAINYLSP